MDHNKCLWHTAYSESKIIISAGQGKLYPNGIYEFPCYQCAYNMIEFLVNLRKYTVIQASEVYGYLTIEGNASIEATQKRKQIMRKRIQAFCGAVGITFCDILKWEHGDYKKLGFIDYATLTLSLYCPGDSHDGYIIKDMAKEYQDLRGTQFQHTTTQTITLGYGLKD